MFEKLSELPDLKKQVVKFTMIGVLAVLVDLGCYYLLLNLIPEQLFGFAPNESVAKSISFLCGMSVTYTLNKIWTWKKRDSSKSRMAKFVTLYGLSLVMNVLVNSSLLFLLHHFADILNLPYKYFIAFIGATGFSAVMNFLGQKFWVFKGDEPETPQA
ncbi:MAG: GtrA family protein [Flavobacteriales bacterium]|nr:GtrA family protein [Flavobacteriales bacterium]